MSNRHRWKLETEQRTKMGAQDESNDKEKNSKDDRTLMPTTMKVTGKRSWGRD